MKNTKTFSRGTVHRIQRNNTPINNLFYENDSVKNQNHAEFRYIKNVVISFIFLLFLCFCIILICVSGFVLFLIVLDVVYVFVKFV